MVSFCSKCGAIMMPKHEGGKLTLHCTKCSHAIKRVDAQAKVMTEKVRREEKSIGVVDADKENLPTTELECRKCGNASAYYWSKQTRAGDEAETRFFRCTACGNTWREYD